MTRNNKLMLAGGIMAPVFPLAVVGLNIWIEVNNYWQHPAAGPVFEGAMVLAAAATVIGVALMVAASYGLGDRR